MRHLIGGLFAGLGLAVAGFFAVLPMRAADAPDPKVLRLPAILSDNMVLQADKPAAVWGWAAPGQTIKVKFAGQEKSATTGADGKWKVMLDPLKVGGPVEMTVEGATTLTVKNILVGEVWLCSGQSNMQVGLNDAANAAEEIKAADFPQMRLFITKLHAPEAPADDLRGQWVECNPQTAGRFSATAYFFGRKIHQTLKVPVGLIQSAQGATMADSWISLEGLKSDPVLEPILKRFEAAAKDPMGWDPHLPTGLYNGEIAPLTPFAIRGAIWYQGESNAGRAFQYRTLFPALIRDWRKARGEDFPFYFVQLANHLKPSAEPANEPWAELREAQALALALPATGMAVAIDIGEGDNIHPKNKQDVGLRLALWALAKTYGQDLVYSGPLYKSMAVEGEKIRVQFAETGGGLEARGGPLKQFAIAGEDKKFVWAEAVIDGAAVVVSSPQVPKPVAVRYAWANNPVGCNLANKEGLPAAPFRTDTWPGVTETAHLLKPGEIPVQARTALPRRMVDPAATMSGNTIEVAVGGTVDRSWDQVKSDAYLYAVQQKFDPATRETRIFLPYGDTRGLYYEVAGIRLTDLEPGNPPALVAEGEGAAGQLALKFHFDKPIRAFRLGGGNAEFQPAHAVAGFEYSIDGKTWKIIHEVGDGGAANQLFDPQKIQADGLNTTDLYLRFYIRDKNNPAILGRGSRIRIRMGGDPGWGDAAQTFARAQWQLVVSGVE